jgi:hypothetical protein
MKGRVSSSVLILGLVSLFVNYEIKFSFANIWWALYGSIAGVVFLTIIGYLMRRSKYLLETSLLLQDSGNFLDKYKYFWLGGLYLGAYTGYSLSVIVKCWYELEYINSLLLIGHQISAWAIMIVLFISETHQKFREIFIVPYGSKITRLNMKEFLISIPVGIILSDYASTVGIIYLGFFLIMYYCIYLFYSWKPEFFIIGGVLFCATNFIVNFYRYFVLKPKLRKIKEDEEKISYILP